MAHAQFSTERLLHLRREAAVIASELRDFAKEAEDEDARVLAEETSQLALEAWDRLWRLMVSTPV